MRVLILSVILAMSIVVIIGVLIYHFHSIKKSKRACLVTEEATIKQCVEAAMNYTHKKRVVAEDYYRY
jgi:hypothetical protein